MKENIIKFMNQVYFGIYHFAGEALPPTLYKGRKTYLHSFWGYRLCCFMIFLYTLSIVSLVIFCLGESIVNLVYRDFGCRLIYFLFILGISFLIERITSLAGAKGLSYFETFIAWPRSTKIKWMIYGLLALIVSAILYALECIIFIFPSLS